MIHVNTHNQRRHINNSNKGGFSFLHGIRYFYITVCDLSQYCNNVSLLTVSRKHVD